MALKIDSKDMKLGFWIGAGLFLFSIFAGIVTYLVNRARGQTGTGTQNG
jgi:hypothetical protein